MTTTNTQGAADLLTDSQIVSACMSYRNDFGLLDAANQAQLMDNARCWESAFLKERDWAAQEAEATHLRELAAYRLTVENLEREIAAQQPAPSAAPAYRDSTPELSVGESSFESWFATYSHANKGDKQRARDAYAAGMGDPLVMKAQADTQPAPVLDYPPLPYRFSWDFRDGVTFDLFTADQMRAYVDSDRAARAPADSVTAPAGAAPTAPEGFQLVKLELLREARDNCRASIAEDGISGMRKEYRIDLEARLTSAVAAHTPTPQADTQPADYPPLPSTYYLVAGQIRGWDEHQMRAYIDADRAARAQADTPIGGEWRIGELDGNWLEIDHKDHPGVLRIVWKMEGDKRTPKCEERAFAVLRALNAATADSVPTIEYLRSQITGMSVSVDVSTGDVDAGHRYFGTVTEMMECQGDKHGVTLLVQDAEPNFKADSMLEDAARYRLVRRGQHWSVIDGIGNELRAEALDAAIDAARAAQKDGEKP